MGIEKKGFVEIYSASNTLAASPNYSLIIKTFC